MLKYYKNFKKQKEQSKIIFNTESDDYNSLQINTMRSAKDQPDNNKQF